MWRDPVVAKKLSAPFPYYPTSSVSLDPLTSQNDHLRNVPPTVSRALTRHKLLP